MSFGTRPVPVKFRVVPSRDVGIPGRILSRPVFVPFGDPWFTHKTCLGIFTSAPKLFRITPPQIVIFQMNPGYIHRNILLRSLNKI